MKVIKKPNSATFANIEQAKGVCYVRILQTVNNGIEKEVIMLNSKHFATEARAITWVANQFA